MGLPTSRDLTFGWQSIVPSAVLNNIQDQIIALHTAIAGLTDPTSAIAAVAAAIAALDAAVAAALAALTPNLVTGDLHVTGDLNVDGNVNATHLKFTYARRRVIPAFAGVDVGAPSGSWQLSYSEFGVPPCMYSFVEDTTRWIIPLPVESGMLIKVWLRVRHPSSGVGATIQAEVWHSDGNDAGVNTGGIGSDNTTALQDMFVLDEHNVVSGHRYWMMIWGAGLNTPRWLYEVVMDWKWV